MGFKVSEFQGFSVIVFQENLRLSVLFALSAFNCFRFEQFWVSGLNSFGYEESALRAFEEFLV